METLSEIAVFVQVVDSGSFTAAADKLGLSKSVVSKYVTRLEDRLGARLLHRTTRRLSLTEVGRAFYRRSRAGLREIEEAEAEVSRLQGEPRGELRLNSPMSFGILHIAPMLPEFRSRFAELTVDMSLDRAVAQSRFPFSANVPKTPDSAFAVSGLPLRRGLDTLPGG